MKRAESVRENEFARGCGPQAVVACSDPEAQQLLTNVLREFGLHSIVSESLDEVLALLAERETVMAFSQPRLGSGNFQDVLRCADGTEPKVPVIVCSEFYDRDLYIEAMALGAFDYLAFPYRRDEVVWVVNNALSSSSLQQGGHA